MSGGLVIRIPLKAKVSGFLTLGPRPGTPEYEVEQAAKASGAPYDYSNGQRLYILDEKEDEPTAPVAFSVSDDEEPPGEGYQG